LEEEKQCSISEPALSPPIIREVAENILEEGGWSAPVCRRKKELQSRRTKRRLPIVVDGRWQRPVTRWIDLGDSAWKHRPPPKSNFGSACFQAKLRNGGPAQSFREEMMDDKAEKVMQTERGCRGMSGGLEGTGRMHGDSCQRSCGAWTRSG
jgi:hypothetical protein